MYLNPIAAPMIDAEGKPIEYDKRYLKEHFEDFYEDAFEELSRFGEVEVWVVLYDTKYKYIYTPNII